MGGTALKTQCHAIILPRSYVNGQFWALERLACPSGVNAYLPALIKFVYNSQNAMWIPVGLMNDRPRLTVFYNWIHRVICFDI